MFRTWTMPGVNGGVVTVRGGTHGATRAVPLSESILTAWLRDPVARPSALQMFEAVTGQPIPASPGVAEPEVRSWVVESLHRAFCAARLVAVVSQPTLAPFSNAVAVRVTAQSERVQPPPVRKSPASEKTWIEIVLVDADDRPVARERCLLRLPDGSERVETLDAEGRLRVSGIDPGRCEITFLDRDGPEWRAA
jgi:hypothetical protein